MQEVVGRCTERFWSVWDCGRSENTRPKREESLQEEGGQRIQGRARRPTEDTEGQAEEMETMDKEAKNDEREGGKRELDGDKETVAVVVKCE